MDDYEFYPESIWVEVQGTVKQLPRRIFESSPVLSSMFDLPQPQDQKPDGSSSQHPLQLEGVELRSLVWFARSADAWVTNNGIPPLTTPAWTSVLALATMWEMDAFRHFIIGHLDVRFGASFTEYAWQVRAGFDCRVEKWKLGGIRCLVLRPDSALSAQEINLLGAECLALILQSRASLNAERQLKFHRAFAMYAECGCNDDERVNCDRCVAYDEMCEAPKHLSDAMDMELVSAAEHILGILPSPRPSKKRRVDDTDAT